MYLSNNMNSFPFSHIPAVWFISRRENLETYYQEISRLRDKVTSLSGGQNVVAILEAAETMKQLYEQICRMEEIFEENLSPYIDEFDPYNKNNLRRIAELAKSLSASFETIARQVSWGLRVDNSVMQIKRNIQPLLRGLEDILEWLERGI